MTILVPPSKFCIYSDDSRAGTLNFINSIESIGVKNKGRVIVDLSKVKFASAAASVLFFAIVNRAQFLTRDPNFIRFKWPKKDDNPSGHRWIVGTGLARALLAGTEEKLNALTREERYFQSAVEPYVNRPGFPGECFICELRLPDHRFRWKHNKLFLLLPEEYGPAFP
ncbi:hypothetical protein R0D11_03400, partial [Escherichia coli]